VIKSTAGKEKEPPRHRQAFEFADQMEQGLAPGLTSAFVRPLEADEQRLRVQRSTNFKEYLLMTQSSEPLLLAVVDPSGARFDIYIVGPGEPASALGPAFLLQSQNSSRKNWTLESVRCERCEARGTRAIGSRQLARLRHYTEPIGQGQALCMDVDVPAPLPAEQDGSAVWCSVCAGHHAEDEFSVSELSSRRPTWNQAQRSLILNFEGRCSLASSKNFQLQVEEGERKLLFGKIGEHLFVLDYKRPFGMVQAFAAALTASHWK
jgi:hypothetical protein